MTESSGKGRPIGYSPIFGEGGAMEKGTRAWSMSASDWDWLEAQGNQSKTIRKAICDRRELFEAIVAQLIELHEQECGCDDLQEYHTRKELEMLTPQTFNVERVAGILGTTPASISRLCGEVAAAIVQDKVMGGRF